MSDGIAVPRNDVWAEKPGRPWPDPTPEMLDTVLFNAVWDAIKRWDINVPGVYEGYMGATGNHARAICDAIELSKVTSP